MKKYILLALVVLFLFVPGRAAAAAADPRCLRLHSDFDSRKTTTAASGLRYAILAAGTRRAQDKQVAITQYFLCSRDDRYIDATSTRSAQFSFTVGAKPVIRGFDELVRLVGI